ncbi:hypothetical protein BD310DRAFT_832388, partial [Dichomitus squalens]
ARDLAIWHPERATAGVECEFHGIEQLAQLDVEGGHVDLGIHALQQQQQRGAVAFHVRQGCCATTWRTASRGRSFCQERALVSSTSRRYSL